MNDLGQIEKLEDRRLLAVGVSFKAKKGILTIKSDGEGDEVDVVGTGTFGEVDVYVDEVYVDTFTGVKTIKANMGGGDDELFLSAVKIGGSVVAKMGAGADGFAVATFGDEIDVAGDVFIGGSVTANMGNNVGDFAAFASDFGGEGPEFGITIGNNVTLAGVHDVLMFGGTGSCDIDPEDITIGGFLRIKGGGLDNEVFLSNVNVGSTTIISLGGGEDVLEIIDSSFARRVGITLGAGDDEVVIADSCFSERVVVNGGGGDNELFDFGGNTFEIDPVLKKIDLVIV